MKVRFLVFLVPVALLLSACNFSLAADITPPPDYVSPTPMPTLGPLYPASAPDPQGGAVIYAQNCSPCHGSAGLGDGPQSMQLPVTVPGIGLPEVARSAAPAAWFKIVTQGNLDRFMPPFAGALSDQQRWDVIAYALMLHTTPEEVSRGRSLLTDHCAVCAAKFQDQSKMASLSETDIVAMIKNGTSDVPAFAKDFSDTDAEAAAAYIRTLTFAAAPEVAAATSPTAAVQGQSLPVGSGTPTAAAVATPAPGIGRVTGSLEVPGSSTPPDLTVTLHGFDHSPDQTSGPQEVLTLSTTAASDGTYAFENVGMPLNRIFLVEAEYHGINYRSDFAAVTAGSTSVALPVLKLYEPSTDASLLHLDQVHVYTDFATPGTVQVLEIFAFTNASNNSIVISTDGTTIPFIRLPDGAQNPGYEAGQDSAPFVAAGKGLAVVPTDKPYSIIAFFNLPYDAALKIAQPLAIDAPSVLLLVPDGIKVEGPQFEARGMQVIQSNNYQEFSASNLKSGDILSFSVAGRPRTSSANAFTLQQGYLIGGGVLGLALIVGGIVLYARERRRQPGEPQESEFESRDAVLDAILALDDLHRAGRIPDKAYQLRREELKDTLRGLS